MSLRIRLSLIASILFLAGMIAGTSFLVGNARQRVSDEVESSATLAYQLLSGLIGSVDEAALDLDNRVLLEQLLAVEEARHISITVETPNTPAPVFPGDNSPINAPAWFAGLVMPPPLEFRIPAGSDGSVISIRTNAADEVSEVWLETRTFLIALLLVLLILNSILYVIIGRWFEPVNTIVKGLEEVEKGNYSEQLEVTSLPELNVIARKLNHLNSVLRDSRRENDRLASRALSIQEEERRRLARELHDELGQSISAVKAIAYSIVERTGHLDAKSAEGANKIGVISENLRDHIRDMMRRLRPSVLDELGLVPAVEQMVDEWNDNHTDCFCRFQTSGDPGQITEANTCINIYRIIQESLTNTASHASAELVEIRLGCDGQDISLGISDNGCGFDAAAIKPGMGLNNIRERARAMNGKIEIQATSGSGVTLEFLIPLPQHADYEKTAASNE
jgi:two-component system sensor histidine kinase UhpB